MSLAATHKRSLRAKIRKQAHASHRDTIEIIPLWMDAVERERNAATDPAIREGLTDTLAFLKAEIYERFERP